MVVMDLSMPGQSGIDALGMIRAKVPDVGILILSGYPEEHYAVNLIRQGAKLVESAQDVLEELGEPSSRLLQEAAVDDAAEEHPLLQHLGFDPVDSDTLQQRSGLDASAINSVLTDLELTGLIESLPGGRWQRIR